ncbi:uncharacterized protein BDW43DRAFT_127608 [Aspergillus alliaceus]|uniref:uncharacterized protein n=1 Tax=Petromyces alliaceus TaxID=209559 RepID=UPI0012A5C932|nr:uncharacterized protein BDW43DRAFT_127608 [Aspergillus alliaceus]KAB8232164.1 hypothetical protein BDW43DRAFT_127608 [Aspergillus alliaceus]
MICWMKRAILRSLGRKWSAAALRTYSSLGERLHRELTSRNLPLNFDYLHTQPSYLLSLTLADTLPKSPAWSHIHTSLPSVNRAPRMPAGHHLVYFPPQVTLSQLLPDGTDVLHSPGGPFDRRLWAGGRVKFPVSRDLTLNGARAVCIELIRDVIVKGREGAEKVIVKIERRIGIVQENEEESSIKERIWKETEDKTDHASIIENRDLIFMRKKTQDELSHDKANFDNNQRVLKPPLGPDFRYTIEPTKSLLFRFSALTFNAHLIHLDETYTRNVEGYRNLLVHGPLTLTLLLTVLEAHLTKSNQTIRELCYRNLAPLYVEEPLTICGKPKIGKDGATWDVWIEGKNGGLAVRATALLSPV